MMSFTLSLLSSFRVVSHSWFSLGTGGLNCVPVQQLPLTACGGWPLWYHKVTDPTQVKASPYQDWQRCAFGLMEWNVITDCCIDMADKHARCGHEHDLSTSVVNGNSCIDNQSTIEITPLWPTAACIQCLLHILSVGASVPRIPLSPASSLPWPSKRPAEHSMGDYRLSLWVADRRGREKSEESEFLWERRPSSKFPLFGRVPTHVDILCVWEHILMFPIPSDNR